MDQENESRKEAKVVVQVEGLRKVYNSVTAVDDVSFDVYEGEIFGMVGPNGAGKTTTIECIEGLRRPDSGDIQVLGLDPRRDGYALRPRIGVQFQEKALQERIKVWEALDLFSSFYPRSIDWEVLLEQLGLVDKRNAPFDKLSGGQKQRLFVALALVNDPEFVFLDELTTGLDPHARRAMLDLVREIRDRGKSVFLTTHFMEEAERLCDRVAIIDHGRIVALDSPENLIRSLGAENRVVFTVGGSFELECLTTLPEVTRVEPIGERVVVYGHGDRLVGNVVNALTAKGVQFRDLRTEQPNLEDVFLALTGREMRE
ncbi:ABC transporter ATP-binding protein [bacterium]|nr:ABC transporter ATP-binding protein [bacterium]